MAKENTVCIVCDLDAQFILSRFGSAGEQFLDFYAHGMNCYFDELNADGQHSVITCLRGYADVTVPLTQQELKKISSGHPAKVTCVLEKLGDASLEGDARKVWDAADARLFASLNGADESSLSIEEFVVRRSGYVLSAARDPLANLFHIAAEKHGVPILHHDPVDVAEHGARKWAEAEATGEAFAREFKAHLSREQLEEIIRQFP